jgi:hypothetical protein
MLFAVTSCSKSGEISASTSCSSYLEHSSEQRHAAAVRLSSELDVPNAGNPMWGLSLDSACGGNGDATIGDVFKNVR